MNPIFAHFVEGFKRAATARRDAGRRIGAELKFPLVNSDGTTASREVVSALWKYLVEKGWKPDHDAVTGNVVGARSQGEHNDTVASCETGYSKTEFSLSHVANLFSLNNAVRRLRDELRTFSDKYGVFFLGYGIHPVTRPGRQLMMKKVRASVWDNVFPSNTHVPPEDGQDIHLFTINSASHVHVGTTMSESVDAVNVLCGFAGAQIALTADSSVWRNQIDPKFKCVAEKFWDWWIPEKDRVGVPPKPFSGLEDYARTVASFRPIFVKRDGVPYLLRTYESFTDYYNSNPATGYTLDGEEVPLVPDEADIDVHSTCYWFNARISHYYTVENRVNDQQPPEDLLCIPALTLGIVSALPEAREAVRSHSWELLLRSREEACRHALHGEIDGVSLTDLSLEMLGLARKGLEERGLGEEIFLEPLERRLRDRRCPADEAADIFEAGGAKALVKARGL